MTNLRKERCPYCGASIHDDIMEAIESIENCTNCLADLKLNGGWTGIGHSIMTYFVEKHGINYVRDSLKKMKLQRI